MKVKINNWKDLREQFGLVNTGDGLKTAIQISSELKQSVLDGNIPDSVIVDYNKNSEAVCVFSLEKVSPDRTEATYCYNGTAN